MLRRHDCGRKMSGARIRERPELAGTSIEKFAAADTCAFFVHATSRVGARSAAQVLHLCTRIFTRLRVVLAPCAVTTIRWHHSFEPDEVATSRDRQRHESLPIRSDPHRAGVRLRDGHRTRDVQRRNAVAFVGAVGRRSAPARLTGIRSAGRAGGTIGRRTSSSPMAPPVATVSTLSLARTRRHEQRRAHA